MSGFTVVTRGRVIAAVVVLLLAAAAYSAWLVWRTERDLRAAERAVDQLEAAVRNEQTAARADAIEELRSTAAAAESRTDGAWWSAMTVVPVVGDDLRGVEALSASLDLLARGAVEPLLDTADSLGDLSGEGGIDLNRLEAMTPDIVGARDALSQARELVESQDSSGYAGAIRPRYDDYVERVGNLDDTISSAERALQVLPTMLGADGPRDYLFIFQNNAEIRATGGIAGSWARIHAESGQLNLREQGSAGDLNTSQPVPGMTDEELAVYDDLPALFFQDPNFIPDFQRAAELYRAFWDRRYPSTPIDGVLSLDPIGMSYLMGGTGPIEADGVTLTAATIVEELLSNTYLTIAEPARQDQRFQAVARSIFESVTGELESPVEFVEGLAEAAGERRFLVSPFDPDEAAALDGTPVLGQSEDGNITAPRVDIGLNDGTGSKMSYYLRYRGEVHARSCAQGVQQLEGSLELDQAITQREARTLPDYVTGGGAFGTAVGNQFVTVRIIGPHGGQVRDVRLNGDPLNPDYSLSIEGRPVVTVGVVVSDVGDIRLSWEMQTRSSDVLQDGAGRLQLTPGVRPGATDQEFASAC